MAAVKLDELPLPAPAVPEGQVHQSAAKSFAIESEVELALEREALRFGGDCRAKGYRMYMDGKNPKVIADALSVPGLTEETVVLWAREGDWALRLKRQNDHRERLVRENIRRKRLEHAEKEVESSLRISNKIREKAEKMLDSKDLTPMGLKNVADASKASGDLGAHGMGETAAENADGAKAAGGKVPLVMIFPAGGLPPVPETMKTVTEV